jgi:F-type H+-transporting ATPase subunit b
MEADVNKARQVLKTDTISLVAQATEKILREKIDAKKDEALIKRVLEKETA